jgi:hypothetical protein
VKDSTARAAKAEDRVTAVYYEKKKREAHSVWGKQRYLPLKHAVRIVTSALRHVLWLFNIHLKALFVIKNTNSVAFNPQANYID